MLPSKDIRRCIIADDLRTSRKLLQTWITPCGFVCESTENGEQAWDAILQSPPSLVVTDIEMPGASGLDLLSSIRKHPSCEIRSIPVIVISSLSDSEIRQFVHDLGGTFFLPKPLEKEAIQRVVSNLTDLASDLNFGDPKGISPTLRRLYRDVKTHGPKLSNG